MGYKTNYAVYKITNLVNNKYYIGCDTCFPRRITQHKLQLKNNKHKNKHLQASYNKYGIENFKFELEILCSNREEMLLKEIETIAYYNSNKEGYNYTIGGEGSFGYKHSKESLKKMAAWKRIITPEWRKNISKGGKGNPHKSSPKINRPDYSKWLGGEKHPVSKLTDLQVQEIRDKYKQKECQIKLALEYNVSKIQIWYIIHNWSRNNENYTFIKNNNSIRNIIDGKKFNSIKEAGEYYNIKIARIYNNLKGRSAFIKINNINLKFIHED